MVDITPPKVSMARQMAGVDVQGTPSLRSLIALVTAISGLIAGVAALRKPPEEPAAKVTYEALQHSIDQLHQESQEVRTDLVTLRNSFAEYVQVKEGSSNFVPLVAGASSSSPITVQVAPSTAVVPEPVARAEGLPLPRPAHSGLVPLQRKIFILPAPTSSARPSPNLPSFSSIQKQVGE